jgi:DHA1 family bicyclomycin/chloramphenicol resistance-like MFS transporter
MVSCSGSTPSAWSPASRPARRLIKRLGPQWVLVAGISAQLVFSAAIVVLYEAGVGFFGLLIPLFFMVAAGGFCVPSIQSLAILNHSERAGTAASVQGASNFGVGGLIAPIVALFPATTPIPMASLMLAAAAVSMAAVWIIVWPSRHAWATI